MSHMLSILLDAPFVHTKYASPTIASTGRVWSISVCLATQTNPTTQSAQPCVSYISKTKVCQGKIVMSECMCSVTVVSDTRVAGYYAPGVETMHHVAYLPLIAVSLFLHTLLVSYVKLTLQYCGKLSPSIGMGWLGTRLHRNCNVMGEAAKISLHIHSTCVQSAILSLLIRQIIPSGQRYTTVNNPLLVLSVSRLSTNSYLSFYVCAADNVSNREILHSNGCWCFSQLYKFQDRIQITWIFRNCGELQG